MIPFRDSPLTRLTDGDYTQASFVEMDFGAELATNLENAVRPLCHNPSLPVFWGEIDAELVAAASHRQRCAPDRPGI